MAGNTKAFEIIQSVEGRSILIHGGYMYHHHGKSEESDVVEWTCTKQKPDKCFGIVRTRGQDIIFSRDHICKQDIGEIEVKKVLIQCQKLAQGSSRCETAVSSNDLSHSNENKAAMFNYSNSEEENQTKVCKTQTAKNEKMIKIGDSRNPNQPVKKVGMRDLNTIDKTFEITKTSKGRECLIHKGFAYRIYKKKNDRILWRCVNEKYYKCQAKLKTYKEEIIECKSHVCISDPDDLEVRKFKQRCKERAQNDLETPIHKIYKEECFPLVQRGIRVPGYSNVKSTFHQARKKVLMGKSEIGSDGSPWSDSCSHFAADNPLNNHSDLIENRLKNISDLTMDESVEPAVRTLSHVNEHVEIEQIPSKNDPVNLLWPAHSDNMQSTFSDLLCSEQFVDVTLSAEGRSIKCHKAVLAAHSSYFTSVFSQFTHEHPIIVVHDVSFWELQSLIEYMYNGKLSLQQEKLPLLFKAAKEFEIMSLTQSQIESNSFKEESSFDTYEPVVGEEIDRNRGDKRKWENIECSGEITDENCFQGRKTPHIIGCSPNILLDPLKIPINKTKLKPAKELEIMSLSRSQIESNSFNEESSFDTYEPVVGGEIDRNREDKRKWEKIECSGEITDENCFQGRKTPHMIECSPNIFLDPLKIPIDENCSSPDKYKIQDFQWLHSSGQSDHSSQSSQVVTFNRINDGAMSKPSTSISFCETTEALIRLPWQEDYNEKDNFKEQAGLYSDSDLGPCSGVQIFIKEENNDSCSE